MHALVQEIADLAADAEDRPRRPVPRLPNDLHLPDQLQVVGLDLIELEPLDPERQAAAERAVAAARTALF